MLNNNITYQGCADRVRDAMIKITGPSSPSFTLMFSNSAYHKLWRTVCKDATVMSQPLTLEKWRRDPDEDNTSLAYVGKARLGDFLARNAYDPFYRSAPQYEVWHKKIIGDGPAYMAARYEELFEGTEAIFFFNNSSSSKNENLIISSTVAQRATFMFALVGSLAMCRCMAGCAAVLEFFMNHLCKPIFDPQN